MEFRRVLFRSDCESIRTAGLPAIVTNNTWQLAPWADVLYAGDYQWWKRYGEECTFAGSRWTYSERASREFDLHWHRAPGGYNTGMRAMQLARDLGASRTLMLGYDTDLANGTHWHGQQQAGQDAKGKKSEERRAGKERDSTGRARWSRYRHKKTNKKQT